MRTLFLRANLVQDEQCSYARYPLCSHDMPQPPSLYVLCKDGHIGEEYLEEIGKRAMLKEGLIHREGDSYEFLKRVHTITSSGVEVRSNPKYVRNTRRSSKFACAVELTLSGFGSEV